MNKLILNTGVQNFIQKNWNADIMSVLLKKPLFHGISQKELVEQLEAKKKCRDKLSTWFKTADIYYPNKLNIEQTSSEQTALYKSSLVAGKTLLDITGGFGVDSYSFSKKVNTVFHCEINPKLSEIAAYNFDVLGQNNIDCIAKDGIAFLRETNLQFDWIYVDPSRRDDQAGKVFLLKDCLPNLPEHLPSIFKKANNVMVKTSPLLDISQGIKELDSVKQIHVVAVNNEVKELLFILSNDFEGAVSVASINLVGDGKEVFSFELGEEVNTKVAFGAPSGYLYEPNSAILKSGGFKSLAKVFKLKKLHQHSHLYTLDELINFPGRSFKILEVLPYSKKSLKALNLAKANVTTRNFPLSVSELRKKHKIKDGGDVYLFFTTDFNDDLIVIKCQKI